MPSQTKKSSVLGKYAGRINQALHDHAEDPIKYGISRLPAGITNGVAQLNECLFGVVEQGKQNAGEPYFRASAVVIEPYQLDDGTVVRWASTTQFRMMGDVKDRDGKVTVTAEDNALWLRNEFLKMVPDLDVSDLEAAAEMLQQLKPFFRFSTSEGRPSIDPATGKPKIDPKTGKPYPPRIWENWHGSRGLEDYTPPEAGGTQDDTKPIGQEANGEEPIGKEVSRYAAKGAAPAARPQANGTKAAPPKTTPPPAQEPSVQFDETNGDLDSLVEAAGNPKDEDAQQAAIDRLTEMALAAGVHQQVIDNAASWQEVAELIGSASQGAVEDQQGGQEEGLTPKKGDVLRHLDPKLKKYVEVDVMSVNTKARTAELRNMNNQKIVYTKVPWDALKPLG